jgi:hypothetical protein
MRASAVVIIALALAAQAAFAGTVSYTGALASPEDDTNAFVVNMAVDGTLEIQTWGFGGGTNAASQVIPAGGIDPFVGVFAGTGPTATLIDGTSDGISNFGSYTGCPPAGTVWPDALCGDVNMQFSLAAGNYTVLLTDAEYIPAAMFEGAGGQLGDGFFDLTPGVFQTCDGNNCITPTANFALDITTPDANTGAPEPATWLICAGGLVFLSIALARKQKVAVRAMVSRRQK